MMIASLALLAGAVSLADEFGQMWAMKYPATYLGWVGDHTYVCVKTGECYSLPGGGNSGGTYLDGTRGYGNRDKARCAAKNIGCTVIWGLNGMCHQAPNRVLFTAGTTVSKARGYWITWSQYGTFGKSSTWLSCRLACRM